MMTVGMLWFDNDKQRGLEDKVARAAAHYRQKYGAAPTACYVHPAALPDGETRLGGLAVKPLRTVLPHHFWLGVDG